jgi:hypothetical protein
MNCQPVKMKKLRTNVGTAAVLGLLALCGYALAEWTEPVPVVEINADTAEEWTPFLSFDGLTLYFTRVRSDTFYEGRIFEATRDEPLGPFTSVGEISSELNSSAGHVISPWVCPDNLRMYYYTESSAGWELKMTERASDNDPWPIGTNITELNVLGNRHQTPRLTADELTIFFSSYNMPGGGGGYDLWMATRPDRNAPFGQVSNLAEINTASSDHAPFVSPDGLTLYFDSDRNGQYQLFGPTRGSLVEPFGDVEHLSVFDTPGGYSVHPCISSDGMAFYFMRQLGEDRTTRDIWVSYWEEPAVLYVDDDAPGANDGSSWENAYNFLQDALTAADTLPRPVEIRVAQGTYKPDQGAGITPGDREATFQLVNGVTIKGGYAGFGEPESDGVATFDIPKDN